MSILDIKSNLYHNYYLGLKGLFNKKSFDESPEIKGVLDELRENGVVVIENFFTDEECKTYKDEIDKKMEEYSKTVWKDDTESDIRIWGAEDVSSIFMKYHNNKFLHEMSERYLKTKVSNLLTLANRTRYREGNKGSGGGWHRDTSYHNQFKSVVYLTDVDENNGPFTYLLGTHKTNNLFDGKVKSDIKKFDFRLDEDFIKKVKDLGYKEIKCTAKRGTLILTDTRGIHRGSPLKEDVRYTLFNYFFPKHHISKKLEEKFAKLRVTS